MIYMAPPKKKSAPPAVPAVPAASSVADFEAAFAGTGAPPQARADFLAWRRDEAAGVVRAVTRDGRKVELPILPPAVEPEIAASENGILP
jgi:hypothetical protein